MNYPNTFTLKVVAALPSLTGTITPSTISGFTIIVGDPLANYGSYEYFTYVDATGVTTSCGAFTYTVSLALLSATNLLPAFTLNSATKDF